MEQMLGLFLSKEV